jgi:hypothetical protein
MCLLGTVSPRSIVGNFVSDLKYSDSLIQGNCAFFGDMDLDYARFEQSSIGMTLRGLAEPVGAGKRDVTVTC